MLGWEKPVETLTTGLKDVRRFGGKLQIRCFNCQNWGVSALPAGGDRR